jgi:hypothetical protein
VPTDREPQLWLWVTRPKFYLGEDGHDSPYLEPDAGFVADGWWTCDPHTKAGDLVLLYRSRLRKDISHFLVVRSDAQRLPDDGTEFGGSYVCEYEVLERFARPVTFARLDADPVLATWHAVLTRMVKRSFPVPPQVWQRLAELLDADFEGLAQKAKDGLHRVRFEKDVEDRIVTLPQLLDDIGLGRLRFCDRQRRLEDGRILDLLYRTGRGPLSRNVVVELKKIKAGRRAVEQVLHYRDQLDQERRSAELRARAVLIAEGITQDAARLAREHGVEFFSLSELRIAVAVRAGARDTRST